ncbi:MAG: hypothetical protein NC416_10015 [Eubacterium sp.]|nr:hypothetical protein [Eubacterium sp.]
MLTIFNRKMIFTTFSMEDQAKIRNILDDNGIKSYVKVINRRGGNGTRSITGSYGENPAYTCEYIIYVYKKDFGLANKYIHNYF